MASQQPFPLMPPKSTQLRLDHFDENVYRADPGTLLYKFVDALCGDAGAGTLKKEIFLQRLTGALDGIYGSDLDYIFGNVRFLSRVTSESYSYNPMTEMLTSEKWDEIAAKDALYRNRIREFFIAAAKGGTVDGIRQAVHAAISCDCQVMENWRYIDNFGLQGNVGRTGAQSYAAVDLDTGHRVTWASEAQAEDYIDGASGYVVQAQKPRSEVTVVPHKTDLHPREARILRDMLDRITPQDTVVTISPEGLAVSSPIKVRAITADSTYFQVEKVVTGAPELADLPAPEMLAIDLAPSENWLKPNSPELAPYAQFNITQEYGYYYLVSGGRRSPIDAVTYGVLGANNEVTLQPSYEWYEQAEQYGPWTAYEKADSPDNYPGGRFGLTPTKTPARNPDRSPYQFPYASQAEYVAKKKDEVISLGGQANDTRYRLPIQKLTTSKRVYTPDLAIAYTAPARDSTVTSSWTSRKPRYTSAELRNPSLFVRS
jgi:hypothetical protein